MTINYHDFMQKRKEFVDQWMDGRPIPWDINLSSSELLEKMTEGAILLVGEETGDKILDAMSRLNNESLQLVAGWTPFSLDDTRELFDNIKVCMPAEFPEEINDGDIQTHTQCLNVACQAVGSLGTVLLDQGWYFVQREAFLICVYAYLFDERFAPYIDKILTHEVEQIFQETMDDYIRFYPHRKEYFQAMINNYYSERFDEFILLGFSQIDGCAFEDFGCSPYSKAYNIPIIISKLKKVMAKEDAAHFEQFLLLYQVSGLFKSFKDEDLKTLTYPNRHAILHGRQLTYGNKRNCMKLVSFAHYMLKCIQNVRMVKE